MRVAEAEREDFNDLRRKNYSEGDNRRERERQDRKGLLREFKGLILALRFEVFGIEEMVSAPSATSLLNRFGILKATKNPSREPDAPKYFAISMSLIKPIILLSRVDAATMPVDLTRELFFMFFS
jgi:hypothetical protein